MSAPDLQRPDLPEFMTWEELEQLPEEIAEEIELWDGRVVWVRREPAEHQVFTLRMTNAFERCARKGMSEDPEQSWRVGLETNVFLGRSGKSNFVTPDFLVYKCPKTPYRDVRADEVLLVGEVLSPSNTPTLVEAKKRRYAEAGIRWYWEVTLARESSAIAVVHAYVLETAYGKVPEGVRPLRPANYLLAGEWIQGDSDGIEYEFPFPIQIPWLELEF